jgi:uncharacterized membrane protein YhhN
MNKSIFLKLYLLVAAINLLLIFLDYGNISPFLKPLLMPLLILYVYYQEAFSAKKFLLIGLFFSWIGDILLLFTSKGELFFITGLLSFLLAHVFYIYLFSKLGATVACKKNLVFWAGIILILIYLQSLLALLLPELGNLKVPVSIYALTISIMLAFAWRGYFIWKKPTRFFILFGAIAFVASDSFLAINKFQSSFEYASFLIMATYLVAQFGIVRGVVSSYIFKKEL